MMDSLITQCPACGTSFKVTGVQLEAAGGAVRCGACLEVFSASDFILNPYPDEMESEDSQLLSAADDADEQSVPWEAESGKAESDRVETADSTDTDTNTDTSGEGPEFGQLSEDEEDPQSLQIDTNFIYHLAEDTELTEVADESPQQSFWESYETESEIEALDEASRKSLDEAIGSDSTKIGEIVPSGGNALKLTLFACASLLLLLALVTQYLWFNRVSLSITEDLREYYLDFCAYAERAVNCALPDYVNLKQISTRRLVVRSHPNINNALIIDAIILNSGVFAQPFPGLELKFSDLESNTVASRRFDASEYLEGELTGLGYIPGGTEVRLALEIIDPGEAAVSYELYAVRTPTPGN